MVPAASQYREACQSLHADDLLRNDHHPSIIVKERCELTWPCVNKGSSYRQRSRGDRGDITAAVAESAVTWEAKESKGRAPNTAEFEHP